jgi:hypothetical protein
MRQYVPTRSYDKRTGKLLYNDKGDNFGQSYQQYHSLKVDVRGGKIEFKNNTTNVIHYLNDAAAKAGGASSGAGGPTGFGPPGGRSGPGFRGGPGMPPPGVGFAPRQGGQPAPPPGRVFK